MKSTQFTFSVTNASDEQRETILKMLTKVAEEHNEHHEENNLPDFEPQCDGALVFDEGFEV